MKKTTWITILTALAAALAAALATLTGSETANSIEWPSVCIQIVQPEATSPCIVNPN